MGKPETKFKWSKRDRARRAAERKTKRELRVWQKAVKNGKALVADKIEILNKRAKRKTVERNLLWLTPAKLTPPEPSAPAQSKAGQPYKRIDPNSEQGRQIARKYLAPP
jgi:hypothetical protein